MLGNKGTRGVIEKVGRSKTRRTNKPSRRHSYKPSEYPTVSMGRGFGKVSRSAILGSPQIKKAKLSHSLSSHRAGSASISTTVSSTKPRRRLMNGINQTVLARILTILAFLAVGGVGLCLILVSANSGGKEVTEPEAVILDPLQSVETEDAMTADDTGGEMTITLGGGIKLQDEVIQAARTGDTFDFNNYLSEMKPVMDSDISLLSVVGNIDGYGSNKGIKGYPSPNYPSQLIGALSNIGVNFAATANSFSLSGGFDAMSKTLSNLSSNGITPVGTYSNAETGNTVCVKRVNSISVGIGAYNCVTSGELKALQSEQTAAGVTGEQMTYCINQLDITSATPVILKDVASMREAGAQFIIICLNWGSADCTSPTYEMRSLAQDMIDNGVDVTLGSGPDIPLRVTVKEYTPSAGPKKKCYVFYSLGNFFSDTSSGADQKEQESMVVKFKLSRAAGSGTVTIASANYYPVFINRDEKYAS
ncbi:MAG: CapA family protein, partial [Clostridia bacterium]|nr:CapA family protein [Clostridia bacterium]